jgi:hypothetical protein
MKKEEKTGMFRYTIRSKETNELLVEEQVQFGNNFPKDYSKSGMALKALWDYESEFIKRYFVVEFEEM